MHKSFFLFVNKDGAQRGVTLLLAVLILSAVLAISFSIATILFVEIRTSGDLLRTEPSLYAAEAVAEQALFKLKRKVPLTTCPSDLPNCYSSTIGNIDVGSTPPLESSIADPIQQDKLPPGVTMPLPNVLPVNATHYPIYTIGSFGPSGYGKIRLTYLPSGNTDHLKVYICQYDPNRGIGSGTNDYRTVPCSDAYPSSDSYWLVRDFDLYPGNSPQSWGPAQGFDPAMQQELVLFNPGTTGPIYVQIETFDSSLVPKGIPYFGETAVDITSKNNSVTRKLRVQVPNN